MKLLLLDTQILSILGANARIPLSKVACLLNKSKQHIAYRISRLEKKGVINHARAVINTDLLKMKKSHYFLKIPVSKKPKSTIASLLYSGKYAQELVCTTSKLYPNEQIVEKVLIQRSYFSLFDLTRYGKNDSSFMLDFLRTKKTRPLDSLDKEIISLLAKNASHTLQEMGKMLKTPYDTVRYRIKKLIHMNYITGFIPQINYDKIGLHIVCFLCKQKPSILLSDSRVIWAAKTQRGYIVYALCDSIEEIHFLDDKVDNYDLLIQKKIESLFFHTNKYL